MLSVACLGSRYSRLQHTATDSVQMTLFIEYQSSDLLEAVTVSGEIGNFLVGDLAGVDRWHACSTFLALL